MLREPVLLLCTAIDEDMLRLYLPDAFREPSEEAPPIAVCLAGCSAFDHSHWGVLWDPLKAKLIAALVGPIERGNDVNALLLPIPPQPTRAVDVMGLDY